MILALGAIGWVLYQASGGKDGDGAIPESYQESMKKAEGVEQTVKEAAELRMQEIDQSNQ
jgi:hypothetical protein